MEEGKACSDDGNMCTVESTSLLVLALLVSTMAFLSFMDSDDGGVDGRLSSVSVAGVWSILWNLYLINSDSKSVSLSAETMLSTSGAVLED